MKTQKLLADAIRHGNQIERDKKTVIMCAAHSEPKQLTINHLAGHGCPECRRLKVSSNTDEFIAKAIIIHGNKFSYNNVVYVNNATKVSITCRQHGDFLQNPNNHLSGQCCRICNNLKRVIPQKEFIDKVTLKHDGKYTYANVVYIRSGEKVNITCRDHGDFLQTPNSHLAGHGCRKCSDLNRELKRKLNADIKQQLSLS